MSGAAIVTGGTGGIGAATCDPGRTPLVPPVAHVVAGRPVPLISLAPVVPGSAVKNAMRAPAAAMPSTADLRPASVYGMGVS